MVYRTRKISKAKYNKHKEITFHSVKIIQLMSIKRPWRKYRFLIMTVSIILTLPTVTLSVDSRELTKLHFDEDVNREARNAVQSLIRKKKKAYSEEKLKANTANPKKLEETVKELGLQSNRSPSCDICLKKKEGLTFDPCAVSVVFWKFYSNLASNLVNKLSAAVNEFGLLYVEVYLKNVLYLQGNKFTFQTIESSSVLKGILL